MVSAHRGPQERRATAECPYEQCKVSRRKKRGATEEKESGLKELLYTKFAASEASRKKVLSA